MTIRKGQAWGHYESRPIDLEVVADDFSASDLISSKILNSESPPKISIVKSGIVRTLGITKSNNTSEQMLCTSFDVIEASYTIANSETSVRRLFVGHAFIHQNRYFGRTTAILNSSFVGKRDWAPKAHPNDGKFDVVELDSSMGVRQRMTAFKLMKSGSHLPHPKIRYTQVPEFVFSSERSAYISFEGIRLGSIKKCVFKLLPDAVNLYW